MAVILQWLQKTSTAESYFQKLQVQPTVSHQQARIMLEKNSQRHWSFSLPR